MNSKKIMIIVGSTLLLAGSGLGGYYAYHEFFAEKAPAAPAVPPVTPPAPAPATQ